MNFLNGLDSGYRAQLKELNEHDFERFGDRLERRAAQLDARIDSTAKALDAKIDIRTAQLDAKIDSRCNELNAKIDSRARDLESRMDAMGKDIEKRMDVGFARLKADLLTWMFVFVATATLAVLGLG